MDEKMTEIAMQIIIHAGDARAFVKEALVDIKKYDFENAKLKLDEAQKSLTKAHSSQTNVIQGEAQGESYEFSLLFAHAQDTLMTIFSELNIAKSLYEILFEVDKRICKLESK